jgi:hypothetical protein
MFPKPGAIRRPGIIRRGDREICRTEYQWQKRREEVFNLAKGRCSRCKRFAPLHDEVNKETGEVQRYAGHAHHKNGTRGHGGWKRDDRIENLDWECWRCHDREHIPQKVVPSKR